MDAGNSMHGAGGGGLWAFIKERKFWILTPIVLIVVMVGVLILLGGNSSELNPFSYSLF